ncbi:uncharacterized protein Gasu_63560, partial [Galdieria sulphuraria]
EPRTKHLEEDKGVGKSVCFIVRAVALFGDW